MKKRLLIIVFLFVSTISFAQTIDSILKTMPSTIIPGLTEGNKTMILMNTDADSITIPFSLGEMKRLIYSDDYLKVKTSEIGTTQLKILQRVNEAPIICLIKTVCEKGCNSNISFYTLDWKQIDNIKFIPELSVEMFFDQQKMGSPEYKYALSLIDIKCIYAEFVQNTNNIAIKLDYNNYLSPESKEKIKPYISNDTIVLKWNKMTFN